MKVLISHPFSNENNRAATYGLLEGNLLSEFHTAIASFPGSLVDRISALGPLSEIRRRRFKSVLQPLTRTWPWLEVGRQLANKTGLPGLIRHETGLLSVDAVYQNLDKRVATGLQKARRRGATAVYAYEDGAAYSFAEAKRLDMTCLYDLPIGYWRAARLLLEPERERWPEWIPTMTGFADSAAKLARKDEELRMADRIFVASQFTATTLQDFPGLLAPIDVIPYGFPAIGRKKDYSSPSNNRPLKLLFVGRLEHRKGIANLFAAVDAIGHHVELTVVGHKASDNCAALNTALARHRWIPSLPHGEVLKLMREHDILVFPSLFEGFGLVITEAMSQGTPVITTERTAGPDLIEHDVNGWLVKAGSTRALQAAIEGILDRPDVVAKAGRAAMKTAERRPWSVYGRELVKAVERQHQLS